MKLRTPLITLPLIACAFVAGSAVADDGPNPGMAGKWVLNPGKSQGPQAATEVLTYKIEGDQEHYMVDEVEKDGKKFKTEYSAKLDGQEYPNKNLVNGNVSYVSIKHVFPRVEELTNIRHVPGANGAETSEVFGHYVRILSPNGKEYTSVLINEKGEVTSVRVFDKAPASK